MRTVLVILLGGIPLISFAQVKANFSFGKETKTIHLTLENEYNDFVLLKSRSDEPMTGTYYTIKLKDMSGKCSET